MRGVHVYSTQHTVRIYVAMQGCVCTYTPLYTYVYLGIDVDLGTVVTVRNVTTVTVVVTLTDDRITTAVNVTIDNVTVPGVGEFAVTRHSTSHQQHCLQLYCISTHWS